MKRFLFILPALLVSLVLGPGHAAWAQSDAAGYDEAYDSEADLLADEELEDLLAPIALYPDPLIAQILPAATFIEQIREAAGHVRRFGKSARIDDQPWDVSVKAVAHYRDVLYMMEENFDWTVSLGQAFVDQQQDVMDAIQRLRENAREQGNLYSTRQQQVIDEAEFIRIVPATPQYVYVPVYDPQVVYVQRYNPSYPFITFGIGFSIGAWLNRDCDWRDRRIYYHGWRGRGWVDRSRPHVRDRRGVYINRRASVINVNNRVMLHDTTRFRQQLRTDTWRRREGRGLTTPPARLDRSRPGTIQQQRPPRVDRQRPSGVIQQRAPRATGGRERTRPPAIRQQTPPAIRQQTPPAIRQQTPPAIRQQAPPAIRQQSPPATRLQAPLATGQPPLATGQQAPPALSQPASGARPEGRPRSRDGSRSREVQTTEPASRSDATIQHQRGEAGRQNRRQINRPPGLSRPAQVVAPSPTVVPAPVVAPTPAPSIVVPAPTVAPAPGAGAIREPSTLRPSATPGERPARQLRQSAPAGGVPSAPRPVIPEGQQLEPRR